VPRQGARARPADGQALADQLEEATAAGFVTPPAPTAPPLVPAAPPSERSVAVLPFANMSADPDDEFFSDGMTEDVINALARLPGLRVAARASAFAFKGQRVDLRRVGEQLRVATVLEGSVRRAGRRVRVSAQLASAADGLHLWSERWDRELADVFAVQDEIADAIAGALGDRLATADDRPAGDRAVDDRPAAAPARGAVSPEAYEQYLRGRFVAEQRFGQRLPEALGYFERAAALAPDFPDAHSWMGVTCALLAIYGALPTVEGFTRARTAAERALALDPAHAHALGVRLLVALWFDWDAAGAEAFGRRAVEAGGGLAGSHELLGWALLARGRFDEAEAEMRRALALDPLSTGALNSAAWAYIIGRRPADALSILDAALGRSPLDAEFHRLRGLTLEAADRLAEASDAFRRTRELDPTNRFATGDLAATLAVAGLRDEARRLVDEMEARARGGRAPAMMLALAYHGLGEDARAFAWLEQALETREFWLSMMHVDPIFRRMWGDTRFEALVRRVGVAANA
jgi:serine/threonine-protein kinase